MTQMEIYKIIYIVLLLSVFFEFSQSINLKRIVLLFWCFFLTLFSGLRWGVGTDWEQYYDHFLQSNWSNIFSYDRYGTGKEILEPGFVFINALIKSLFGEFYIYNIIITFFIQITNYKFSTFFSKKHPILLFVFISLIQAVCFPVRAQLSQAICYWAYILLFDKKNIKALIVIILASLIHKQCLALLPLVFIGRIKIQGYLFLLLFALLSISTFLLQKYFIMITMLFDNGIAEKAQWYTEFETETGGKNFGLMAIALNLFFLINYLVIRKLENLKDDLFYNTILNAYFVYLGIFFAFSDGMGDLARLSFLYFPAHAILFSKTVDYYLNEKKMIFKYCVSLFYVSYGIYKIIQIGSWYFFEEAMIPYRTIFD